MSNDNSQWVKRAAIAGAIGAAGGLGLYYLLSKRNAKSKTAEVPSVENMTVEQMKQLGNKLFSTKKYDEAIDIFTKAIAKSEEGAEVLKAMCFQNRAAAKERLGGFTVDEMLIDCIESLKRNPAYGKAYWRKARLHEKKKQFHEALVDTFCATHLDASFDKQTASILPLLLEEVEKIRHQAWNASHTKGEQKPIRHEKVYTWLHKTVHNDGIRNDVLNWKGPGTTPYEKSLEMIGEKYYEEVPAMAETEEGEKQLGALILAARFYSYQNREAECNRCLEKFDSLYNSLIDPEKEAKAALIASKHILLIEKSCTKDDIMKTYYAAIASDIRNVDFYAMAAFRLVLCGEAHEAMKILSTEGIDGNNNIKLLRFTLAILANTDGQMDAAVLHNAILQLETFVNELNPKTPYSQSLLAKVYATFGQDAMSRQLMDSVVSSDETTSIHHFDRSCMAENGAEAIVYLEKCLKIEPHHAEANLMCASLKLNEIGNKLMTRDKYTSLSAYIDRAEAMFDGTIDFPVIQGVFRMREVLEAKREAALKLGTF